MKKMASISIAVLLAMTSFLGISGIASISHAEQAGETTILETVPDSYMTEAENGGTVVSLSYTASSNDAENQSKHALVYLPFDYNDARQYNVLYLMHGGGGNAESYFDGEGQSSALKRMLDHMIAEGELEPLIVVTPSFYPDGTNGVSTEALGSLTELFQHELVNDLIPAVEGTYSTYADSIDIDGIRASRTHRAFGGFSMGSVTTWYTFIHCLDAFAYFMPMSGDCWAVDSRMVDAASAQETAAYLADIVTESEYGAKDFFVYALTGTQDMAYAPMVAQIDAMKAFTDSFVFSDDPDIENLRFAIKDGGTHDYPTVRQYIYNALPMFW